MIPKTNSPFQTPTPNILSTNSQETTFINATKNLINAVAYASENEMAILVDRAISQGAKINYYDSYENHLMVIAVRNRQSHAIPILMARGMEMPDVPQNGIDLLMLAAAAGSEEVIDLLINLAEMDVFASDADGKTALHHAAIGGSIKIVGILLDYGAKPNVHTSKMDDAELRSLFGDNHNQSGSNITPLMIASAAGNHEIVSHLLAAGADPTDGECLPLVLACTKKDVPTIKLLLAQQTQEKFLYLEEQAILSTALKNGASLECLRLIVSHHCFIDDNETPNSPLALAIQTKQASNVALLLANGATIEKFNSESNTLWDDAFLHEKKLWELLDLLVTTCPFSHISSADYSKQNFLIIFFENCQNPIKLAALGFYPSVVESSRDELQQLHANALPLAKMEKQLLAAFILSTNIKQLSDVSESNIVNSDSTEPDSQWIKLTHEKKQEQKTQLLEETIRFTNEKFTQLKNSLTLEFFIECNNLCLINRSLKNFILNKLIADIGIPFNISESIATIWSQAAQWGVDWHIAPHSINDANRFLTHLSKNLFNKNFFSSHSNEESLQNHCITLIADELGNSTNPLSIFCKNPVAWLRKFENRSNLRAVNGNELANALQIELGLHISTCQAISTAWSTTITLARQSRQWRNPVELEIFLGLALAPQMENCINDEFAYRIVPEHDREKLSQWIESVINQVAQVDFQVSGRKRPPSGDPEGTPPAKEARV
jgi:hypothetical protein